ncbi:hypothetical protein G6F31_015148 [Rhizopus arrhizus]|nr:hypothetical protein G6F31_015148 [Rhizopus arrhizus]
MSARALVHRQPDFHAAIAGVLIEAGVVAFQVRRIGQAQARVGKVVVQQPEPGGADAGDVPAVPGHQIATCGHRDPLPMRGYGRSRAGRQCRDVVEAAVVIAVAAHAEADRRWRWPFAVELRPLPGNRTATVTGVAHADAGNLEGGGVEQARSFRAGGRRFIHAYCLHQCQSSDAILAHPLRRLPELFAEGAGERGMGGVARRQCHRQDVTRTLGQSLRGGA